MDIRSDDLMLEIKDLRVSFRSVAGTVRAVNGVSLQVRQGEIAGLVGESGCGKSVTARSTVKLVASPPAVYEGGEIWLKTRDGIVNVACLEQNSGQLRRIRGRDVAMIFQEPMRSLHPMMNIGTQITEGILQHEDVNAKAALVRTQEMLEMVGLPQPGRLLSRYPHELSGGMRQRVMIALALVCRPQLLIADEPTTALDVTIQAQILDLIRDLRRRMGMSVLLITHNMGVIASIADRVSVMYLGVIVETGSVHALFEHPAHPYAQGLLSSIPSLFSVAKTELPSLRGTVPELAAIPKGCIFADRCPYVMSRCSDEPPVVEIGPEHSAKCWLCAPSGRHSGVLVGRMRSVTTRGTAVASTPSPDETLPGDQQAAMPGPEEAPAVAQQSSIQLQVEGLKLHYPILKGVFRRRVGTVRAVDGVDLTIHTGETVGLVGESGCGKTSVGRLVTRLLEPDAGRICFRVDGQLEDITTLPQSEMKRVRRHMGMVFQDPMSSLNPMKNVRNIVGEPLILHKITKARHLDDRVGELLETAGLRAEHRSRFPHSFSGGQRQRIAIARALAVGPQFIVADEPVSALDVSIQSQVLNLLRELQRKLRLSMLFIAHDIAVVRHVSDRIAVMYLGKIVEIGDARGVCSRPVHPYTEALLASIPLPDPSIPSAQTAAIGELPDPGNPPMGCRFHTRCRYRQHMCEVEEPVLGPLAEDPDHMGACHFQDELALTGVDALRSRISQAAS